VRYDAQRREVRIERQRPVGRMRWTIQRRLPFDFHLEGWDVVP